MQQILKTYLKRLTNLTARNRSLLLTQLPVEQFLDLHELDFLDGKPSFELISQLISQKESIPLCAVLDSRFEKVNLLSKHLSKIARTEQFIKTERGAEDLYVGFPMLQGKFADGTVVRAPLLFFPVTLVTNSARFSETQALKWHLRKRDEPITLNRSFLLAYGHFNQTPIPDELLEKSFDDFDKDSLIFLTQLYEFLKTSPIELNFNQDLFQRQLIHFEKLTKPDLEQTEKNGELKLYPQAVLGIFPQAGSYLAPDYEELLRPPAPSGGVDASLSAEDNATSDLRSFFQKSSIADIPPLGGRGLKEESLLTPLPVDASQEQALQLVKQGASLVVQGPPGTGKSQLIANLIADFTARGKKVLLVCQKRVALDTVHERLKRLGMSGFVALVHDFKNDRKALYQQLANQIEQVEAYQKQNNSLDAIVLERDYLQICRRIDQLSDELQSLKNALFDESVCGLSVKKLYLSSNPNEPHVSLDNLYQSFHFQEISDFLQRLDTYQVYAQRVNTPTHPWAQRVDFAEIRFAEIPQIEATLGDIPIFLQQLAERAEPFTYHDLQALLPHRYTLETIAEHLAEPAVYPLFTKLHTDKNFNSQFVQLQDETNDYQQQGLLQPLRTDELGAFSALLKRAIEARRSVFNWWFFSEKQALQAITSSCGFSTDLSDLQKLERLLANRLSFERCIEAFKGLCGLNKTLKFNLLSVTIQQYEHFCKQWNTAQQAYELLKKVPSFLQGWLHLTLDFSTFQTRLATLLDLLDDFNQKQIYWQQYLTESQIESIVEQPNLIEDLLTSLRQDFEMLHEADSLKKNFSRVETEVVFKLSAPSTPLQPTYIYPPLPLQGGELHKGGFELLPLFQNSLRLAWIAHIEAKYPILQGVSSLKIKQMEAELQTAVQKKQALSREILLLKLREHTYKNLEVNRLQNVVTYRNLKHQVTKKRNIWAIRHLLAELSEEVFPLVPCWMASPEAVSAVFPLTSTTNKATISTTSLQARADLQSPSPAGEGFRMRFFDLVIFDEASQCFAEHGLPALYRGQQVVIAGDSKQLQPTDLYRIRFEQETEELPELEIDSLLDLATQYLPQAQLTGHYRSQSLDLIDFSNQHFYKNSLQLLPHFEEINRLTPAIHYLKVAGVWQNNTNGIEAQRIVELVQELAIKEPHLSIGIVTFNHPQQALIQELLEQSANPELQSGLGGRLTTDNSQAIFVKNIENVQGDERDVIIFSVAYAPDAKGRMAMQFGSLNMAGGENRLNVAVTRARKRVYVVASIMPHQLLVDSAANEGPKLLKKYLQYALDVSEGRYKPQPKPSKGFRQEWMLKNKLSVNRYPLISTNATTDFKPEQQLSFELPFADLTVKYKNQYDSLILTDDDLYYQSLSPKEAHAYLPINLQEKGWTFQRIWSREWWKIKK